jgi:hypothetical protein
MLPAVEYIGDTAPTWTWAVPLIVGVIALTGVIATAVVSYQNTKRQLRSAHILKIAEMRQAWLNDLRNTMALCHSYGISPEIDPHTKREFYETGTKIELMMNPLDVDFEVLRKAIYKFQDASTQDERFAVDEEYVAICQRILKREWTALQREVTPWRRLLAAELETSVLPKESTS